jgi:hypothetical protein
LDRECEAQTIDRQSTVDKPLVAAVHKDMNKNHIGMQSQGVESINVSIDGKKLFSFGNRFKKSD